MVSSIPIHPPHVDPSLPAVDLDRLKHILGDDDDAVRSVIPVFLEDGSGSLHRLREAVRNGDTRGMWIEGHKIAGNAATFAAMETAAWARIIEQLGIAKSTAGAQEIFDGLTVAWSRVVSQLESHCPVPKI